MASVRPSLKTRSRFSGPNSTTTSAPGRSSMTPRQRHCRFKRTDTARGVPQEGRRVAGVGVVKPLGLRVEPAEEDGREMPFGKVPAELVVQPSKDFPGMSPALASRQTIARTIAVWERGGDVVPGGGLRPGSPDAAPRKQHERHRRRPRPGPLEGIAPRVRVGRVGLAQEGGAPTGPAEPFPSRVFPPPPDRRGRATWR